MTEFAKMDVFFFVTTIAVIIFTLLVAVAAIYIIKILRDIKYITKKAKSEADIISEELSDLRDNVKTQGAKLKFFGNFFNNIYKKSKK
jgi:predicted Holliday junction resolvase-like endonuclease